jgi:hypothetical protein
MSDLDSTKSNTADHDLGRRKVRAREVSSTDEPVERWAEREHKRRRAWLEGPTEWEKREWARQEHRRLEVRHMFSGPTAPGPTDEEVEEWAEREHKRRNAWLKGPTEQEKRDWARREQMRLEAKDQFGPPALEPTDEEVEDWADRERKRRRAWVDGPTEREKDDWERRECGPERGYSYRSAWTNRPERWDMEEAAADFWRRVELASKGSFSLLMDWPFQAWERLMDAGREAEERHYGPTRPRRIRFND